MDPTLLLQDAINRRTFLKRSGGLGLSALFTLLGTEGLAAMASGPKPKRVGGLPNMPEFTPKAKRVIYLFQSGAPSQMDLFDPKPMLTEKRGEDLPSTIRNGQRLTGMTSGQKMFPVAPSIFKFEKH